MPGGTELVTAGVGNAATKAGKSAGSRLVSKLVSPRPTNTKEILSSSRRADNLLAHSINDTSTAKPTKIRLSTDLKDGLHVIMEHYHEAFYALVSQNEFASLQLNMNSVDPTRGGCAAFFFGEKIISYTLALPPNTRGETFYSPDDAQTTTMLRQILRPIDSKKKLHDDWALAALLYLRLNEQVEQLAFTFPKKKEELYAALKSFVSNCEDSLEIKNSTSQSPNRQQTIHILSKLKENKNQQDKAISKTETLSKVVPELKSKIGTLLPSMDCIAQQFIKGEFHDTKATNPDIAVLLENSSTVEYKYVKWPEAYKPSGWFSWNVTETKSNHYGKIISVRNLIKKVIKYFYQYVEASKLVKPDIQTLKRKLNSLKKIIKIMTHIAELTSELCSAAKEGILEAYNREAIIAHTTSQLLARGRFRNAKETVQKVKQDDIPTLNIFFLKSILELCYLELIYMCTNSIEYLVLDSSLSSKNQVIDEFRSFLHIFTQGFTQFIDELDIVATQKTVSCLHKNYQKGKVRNVTLDEARADSLKTIRGTTEQRRLLQSGASLSEKKPTPSMKSLLYKMDEILRDTRNIPQDSMSANLVSLSMDILIGFNRMITDQEELSSKYIGKSFSEQGLKNIAELKTSIEKSLAKMTEEEGKEGFLETQSTQDSRKVNSQGSTSSHSTLEGSDEYNKNLSTTASSGSMDHCMNHLVKLQPVLYKSSDEYRSIEPGGLFGLGAYDLFSKWGRHSLAMKQKMLEIRDHVIDLIQNALDNVDKHQAIIAIHQYIRQQIETYQPENPPFEQRSIGYFLQQHLTPIIETYERQTTLSEINLEEHQASYNGMEAKTEEPDGIGMRSNRLRETRNIGQKTPEDDDDLRLHVQHRREEEPHQTQKKKTKRFSIFSKKKKGKKQRSSPLPRRSTPLHLKIHETTNFSPMTLRQRQTSLLS